MDIDLFQRSEMQVSQWLGKDGEPIGGQDFVLEIIRLESLTEFWWNCTLSAPIFRTHLRCYPRHAFLRYVNVQITIPFFFGICTKQHRATLIHEEVYPVSSVCFLSTWREKHTLETSCIFSWSTFSLSLSLCVRWTENVNYALIVTGVN